MMLFRSPFAFALALALALRIAAFAVLHPVLESDALSYMTMARSVAAGGPITDTFGQHIFYSPGYALLLAPVLVVADHGLLSALALNLALTALTLWLMRALVRRLDLPVPVQAVALVGYALWLPAIWDATLPARETLSAPLLLAVALCAVRLCRGARAGTALLAGLLWGAALLTGGSALPLIAAPLLGICFGHGGNPRRLALSMTALAVGAALVLGPWLYAARAMTGAPMLSSSAPFNLYLGNNPAATGGFVSISDTPMGRDWEATRARLGEAGTAQRLQAEATAWIAAHPGAAGDLALRKLALFWAPNLPDAQDFATARTVALIRLVDVAQWSLILLCGLVGIACWPRTYRREGLVLLALATGFWLVHAAAYIIPRYRDPLGPLLLLVAAIGLARLMQGTAIYRMFAGRR